MIHSNLSPMMYQPNSFTLNLKQMLSGAPIDVAIGVIKVIVHGTHSISNGCAIVVEGGYRREECRGNTWWQGALESR
jgi:Ca2+-dependent lipid-binding protein